MADYGSSVGRELSTVSTPPTSRTSVEASEQRRVLSEARTGEETLGDSSDLGRFAGERGEKREAGPVNAAWEHALRARNSCLLGHCKYANPNGRPNSHMGAQGCDGYHASEHIDADGWVTVRWYLCPRHREWWRQERIRQHAARLPKIAHPGIGPER